MIRHGRMAGYGGIGMLSCRGAAAQAKVGSGIPDGGGCGVRGGGKKG